MLEEVPRACPVYLHPAPRPAGLLPASTVPLQPFSSFGHRFVWLFVFFLQLTQFLKVREQAKTFGERSSKDVDPGRKVPPFCRAEEGLSYHSGWDLRPALSS